MSRIFAMIDCRIKLRCGGFARLFAILCAGILLMPQAARAEDQKTGSRTPFVHNIPLRDAEGHVISLASLLDDAGKLQDAKGAPFSTAQTCGKCHEYETISHGWHFNAARGNVKAGRPGEPWILTDAASHTQIPLSYRGWPGTFKPGDLGLSDFDFLAAFARHYPGGGVGEPEKIDDDNPRLRRFAVSGALQIDCLICHEATGRYSHEARFNALRAEEFKWSPTIGAGLGTVAGFRTAKTIADGWKPGRDVPTNVPAIKYDRARFDADNNVLLQMTRRPSPNACYYCHTMNTHAGDANWQSDRDVHLRAGMICVDCHRNGVDHMIVRGYEGEAKDRAVTPDMIGIRAAFLRRDDASLTTETAKPLAEKQLNDEIGLVETLSCKGCHLGTEAKGKTAQLGGRLGAPRPVHKGIPIIHFEKMTCTACHAGPLPGAEAQTVQTSMAHKLGLPGPARGTNTPPVIVEPVFLRDANGKIAPYKMMWPSYWGRLSKDGKVTPLGWNLVSNIHFPVESDEEIARDPYSSKPLDKTIETLLSELNAVVINSNDGGSIVHQDEGVFIAAGKMYRLESGVVKSAEHDAAKPYAWALAHDVRPARQALGARGCAECHSADSPVYFGNVTARGPVDFASGLRKTMWQFRGDDRMVATSFAYTFVFRPLLKVICFAAAAVVALVLVYYALLGIGAITGRARAREEKEKP